MRTTQTTQTVYFRLAAVLAALLVLAACGQQQGSQGGPYSGAAQAPPANVIGPSAAKVKLDLQDRLNASHHGMIRLAGFKITGRQVLAEDRVTIDIVIGIGLDEARVQWYREGGATRLFDRQDAEDADDAERFYQGAKGSTAPLTVLYRKTAPGMWRLAGMVP